ncbi:MAG: acyltransferase family protein, partial [Lachnospiraceae bacterium]|nr:acyltransferase family protein [Lachnospiraceae bacterium]
RYKFIDFYKFIGITLMIMGHVGFGSEFDKFIHAFHMPLFFIASGFCFSGGRPFRDFLRKKVKSILVPYFVFSLISFLALRKINEIRLSSMQHVVWINNDGTPIAGVWFLTALFFANIVYYWIDKISDNNVKWFVVVVFFLLGASLESWVEITIPWSIAPGMVGILFLHVGKCSKEMKRDIAPTWSLALGIGVTTVLIFINDHVNIRISHYDYLALFFFNAVLMCVLILIASERIENAISESRIFSLSCSIGMNSICYLVLNQMAIRYSCVFVDSMPENATWGGIRPVIILVLSYVVMYFVTELITRTGLCILIGQKYTKKGSI